MPIIGNIATCIQDTNLYAVTLTITVLKTLCVNCRKMVFVKFLTKCEPCLNKIIVIRKFLNVFKFNIAGNNPVILKF